jgi:hypothetical protein
MKVSLLTQGPSEDVATFTRRVNDELARLGDAVKDVKMSTGIHEVTIAGRLALPRVITSILIICEDRGA